MLKTFYITRHERTEFKMHYGYGMPSPIVKLVGVDDCDAIRNMTEKNVLEMFDSEEFGSSMVPFMANQSKFKGKDKDDLFDSFVKEYGNKGVLEQVLKLACTNPKKFKDAMVRTFKQGYYTYLIIDADERLFKIMVLNERKY